MKELKLNTPCIIEGRVLEEETALHMRSGSLRVFATPALVAKMEQAACGVLEEFLEDGETTVGTAMDIQHLAPTPVGGRYSVRAEITAVNGREITFHVSASDEAGEIGNGTHKRFLVYAEKFQDKANKRGQ